MAPPSITNSFDAVSEFNGNTKPLDYVDNGNTSQLCNDANVTEKRMDWELPVAQGLYDPQNEHEACGVGFIVAIDGRRSHKVIIYSKVNQQFELLIWCVCVCFFFYL